MKKNHIFKKRVFSQITFFQKGHGGQHLHLPTMFLKILFCTFWYINQPILEKKFQIYFWVNF